MTARMILVLAICFFANMAQAITEGSYEIGAGLLYAGLIDRVTTQETAKSDTLGSGYYSLHFGTTHTLGRWYINPYLNYSLAQAKQSGGSTTNNVWMLGLPFAQNFPSSQIFTDWNFSFGVYNYTIKGGGGTKELNNGGGTSTFAIPNQSISSRQFFAGAGLANQWGNFRSSYDLFALAPLNTQKMTFNFMLNLMYSGDLR